MSLSLKGHFKPFRAKIQRSNVSSLCWNSHVMKLLYSQRHYWRNKISYCGFKISGIFPEVSNILAMIVDSLLWVTFFFKMFTVDIQQMSESRVRAQMEIRIQLRSGRKSERYFECDYYQKAFLCLYRYEKSESNYILWKVCFSRF